jgi:hypothetical protein
MGILLVPQESGIASRPFRGWFWIACRPLLDGIAIGPYEMSAVCRLRSDGSAATTVRMKSRPEQSRKH